MFEWLLSEIVNNALQNAAENTGKELGHELRNFLKTSRGETEWEDLTHVQQTMFFGGDKAGYESIREKLKSTKSSESSSRRTDKYHDNDSDIPDGPFFDYEKF